MIARGTRLGRLPFLQRIFLITSGPVCATKTSIGKTRVGTEHHSAKGEKESQQNKFQIQTILPLAVVIMRNKLVNVLIISLLQIEMYHR